MSDAADTPCTPAGATDDHIPARLPGTRPWLAKLAAYLASFAGGAAVNDLSTTLGYHGLAGAVALLAVVTAVIWIRGLHPRARLQRYATWLFLTPAAVTAGTAAFSSGTAAAILTATAAILTIGAVLIPKELPSAAKLLAGAALIALGAVAIAAGITVTVQVSRLDNLAQGALAGAPSFAVGSALIAGGAAGIADRRRLAGSALIAGGAALIAFGTVNIAHYATASGKLAAYIDSHSLVAVEAAKIAIGAAAIAGGAAIIAGRRRLAGAAAIAIGATIVAQYADGYIGLSQISLIDKDMAIAIGAAAIAGGAAIIAGRRRLAGAAAIAIGATIIADEAIYLTGEGTLNTQGTLFGAALIAFAAAAIAAGVFAIGPHTIATRARQAIEWATKPPRAIGEPGQQSQTGRHRRGVTLPRQGTRASSPQIRQRGSEPGPRHARLPQ